MIGLPYLGFFHGEGFTCFRAGNSGEFSFDLLLPRETPPEPMLAPTFTPPPRHAGERLDSPADRSDAG